MGMAGPRFFGFVIGGALPVAVAANWLATAWDQNTGLYAATPGTAHIEQAALARLLDVLRPAARSRRRLRHRRHGGQPHRAGRRAASRAGRCRLVGGGRRAVWRAARHGDRGRGSTSHVVEITRRAGPGRQRVARVPVDDQGRMRLDALPRISGPTILCVQAGNVNTGAFDPIREISQRAHDAGAWVHVDGAFGLWARATPARAQLAAGVELADSWATDAHKWLNVPYDSGVAFVRDAAALRAAMAITAEYLPTAGPQRNPSDYTPELSRRARGVDIWAVLETLGRSGVAAMIERCCGHAARFRRGSLRCGLSRY